MNEGIRTVIFPVTDVEAAKALYTRLVGVEPYMEEPYYVGYRIGDQEIRLDPQGDRKGMTGPLAYWHVSDIKESLQALLDGGAQTQDDIRDVGGGKLIAWVRDPDGNPIGLVQEP